MDTVYSLYDALCLCFEKQKYNVPNNKQNITKEQLLLFIASKESTKYGALGLSVKSWTRFIYKVFPDKPKNTNYYNWLLQKHNLKYCNRCNLVKTSDSFWKNKSDTTGLNGYCVSCMTPLNKEAQRSNQANYRAAKIAAMPNWVDRKAIKSIYDNCPVDYQVDHIIPLRGKYVCGLHVPWNLQYLSKFDNNSKNNYHESELAFLVK